MRTMALLSLQSNLSQLANPIASTTKTIPSLTRRGALAFASSILVSSCLGLANLNPTPPLALAQNYLQDELQQQEDLLVHLFEETSPSVVFIKDIELSEVPTPSSNQVMMLNEDAYAKVEGTGSGFIWDQFGHIVTNYHVVAKLATDTSGLQRCKVFLVDAKGNSFFSEGKIIGFDPAYDLAVLKIDVDGHEIRPVVVGQSKNLHVGQSCFAIGNPYGYENTLTTGVVSGLGREIPSPNGRAIQGAIQTDADINAGKQHT
ncbi:Protease Do-like 5, chloroplastic, variant 3 [Stylosanthes scabra]|uniref:Protease Do-like 5, chloroplastic, variant 3 n=1 Tax=Stylosanthes scabra TaxID=79078 RepID=A0ABU6WBX4_9FABA|nr:Protease Do-like 5, chloroplastic, variant 3 [Stylosanthes scabra]